MIRPSIAIVGPGRLGTALAVHLQRAGYRIDEIVAGTTAKSLARARSLARRVGARASRSQTARLQAGIIWFCVPDSQIGKAADRFNAKIGKGQFAFHSSGVLPSDSLSALRKKGAAAASVHPLMTFVAGALPDLEAVTLVLEGDPPAVSLATSIVRNLRAIPKRIRKQDKPAYHAFATMICPLIIALLASAEEAARLAGVAATDTRNRILPILKQTIANYAKFGSAKAFTGPIVRGDIETVHLHLQALAKSPAAQNVYTVLARAAIDLLPARNKNELEKLIERFSPRTRR